MKTALAVILALAITGCSNSSPTEPVALASLSGYVQLCGFDALTVLTVTDSRGIMHTAAIDGNGNYSFPAVLALGPYTMTATRSPLAPKSINGDKPLVAGANQWFWVNIIGCASMTVRLDRTTCTPLINGSASGTLTQTATGWHTVSVSVAPGESVTAPSLPSTGDYRILFRGVYKDGRAVQWDYTRTVSSVFSPYTFTMTCSATLGLNGPTFR